MDTEPNERVREHVDVVVRGRSGRDGEAVDQNGPVADASGPVTVTASSESPSAD